MYKKKIFFFIIIFFLLQNLSLNLFANTNTNTSAVDLYNSLVKIKDIDKTESVLNKIITDHPTSIYAAKALLKLSEIQELKANYQSALNYLEKIINNYSHTSLYKQALYKSAIIYHQRLNNFEKSESYLQNCLKNDNDLPSRADIFARLGDLYFYRSKFAEALQYYNNALLNNDDCSFKSWVYFQIGNCFNATNQLNEAFVAYMTVVKFFPQSPEYFQANEMIEKLKNKKVTVDYKIISETNPIYKYYIQLGAFKNKNNAENLLTNITANKKYSSKIARMVFEDNFYKVKLGNFFSYEEAQSFKNANKIDGIILKE